MNGSFKIGTAFGIPIRVHWMFLPFVLVLIGSPFLIVTLFGSVFLHELGHSLVARSFGIQVLDITFWPLGGMARMNRMPESPRVEGLVAIAGPAVNFVLVGITLPLMLLASVAHPQGALMQATWSFLTINLLLGTFNLLPAFPMDGGRIVRAFLGRRHDWVTATEKAVRIGRFVALAMVLLPLVGFLADNAAAQSFCMMPVIAAFVWFAGGQELMSVRLRHGRSPFGHAMPFGGAPFAEPAPHEAPPPPPHERPRRGFDETAIEALERYRGRLRNYRVDE